MRGTCSGRRLAGPAEREEIEHREEVEHIIDFLEIQAHPQDAGRPPALRPAEARRARPALAAEPKLLLLDEPMAGMNIEEKEDMSRFILDVNDNSAPP